MKTHTENNVQAHKRTCRHAHARSREGDSLLQYSVSILLVLSHTLALSILSRVPCLTVAHTFLLSLSPPLISLSIPLFAPTSPLTHPLLSLSLSHSHSHSHSHSLSRSLSLSLTLLSLTLTLTLALIHSLALSLSLSLALPLSGSRPRSRSHNRSGGQVSRTVTTLSTILYSNSATVSAAAFGTAASTSPRALAAQRVLKERTSNAAVFLPK